MWQAFLIPPYRVEDVHVHGLGDHADLLAIHATLFKDVRGPLSGNPHLV
jgi:hypothetical protein